MNNNYISRGSVRGSRRGGRAPAAGFLPSRGCEVALLAEGHRQVPVPRPVSPVSPRFCCVPVVLTASGAAGSLQALPRASPGGSGCGELSRREGSWYTELGLPAQGFGGGESTALIAALHRHHLLLKSGCSESSHPNPPRSGWEKSFNSSAKNIWPKNLGE